MISIRRSSLRAQSRDDGSGRIALIGLLVVLALIVAAVRLAAQDVSNASPHHAGAQAVLEN